MNYMTLTLPFNVDGDEGKRLLSTAWLFKTATHRMLYLARQSPILPASPQRHKKT